MSHIFSSLNESLTSVLPKKIKEKITMIYLILLALLPAFILCGYVYSKDKVEKEPKGLLSVLFLFGVLSCIPAAILEGIFEDIVEAVFSPIAGSSLYNFIYFVLAIALVEEGLKWLILVYKTSKNENFNCTFDALIYSIFVSLGFAALENVLYVTSNGVMNGILRAVLSVPGHMFFAVFMGLYYGEWQMKKRVCDAENKLYEKGLINAVCSKGYKKSRFLSLFVPVIVHGFYNHCCTTMDAPGGFLIFLALMVFLYVRGFGKIKKMSANDCYSEDAIREKLVNKYPELEYEQLDEILFL